MLLTMPLTACVTVKNKEAETVVPELVFPVFPALEGGVKNADGSVTVPGEWLVRLAEYRIRIGETEKTYEDLKALYRGTEKK